MSGKYEYCQGDVREMSGNFEEACCYEPWVNLMGALTFLFFLFLLKLIVAYRLCVIYVRKDNDFNV